jgi:choline kinase
MKAIIIGAGRGRRLMPTTAETPKCYAEVKGKRLLDWGLQAFAAAGVTDICFIGGYQIEKVRRDYPQFTFRHNTGWEQNNILASLMHAEDVMEEGFVCCYSDILFTPAVVSGLLKQSGDIVLSVDTRWLERYRHRTQHPPDDAEKVTAQNGHDPDSPRDPTAGVGGDIRPRKIFPAGAAHSTHGAQKRYMRQGVS